MRIIVSVDTEADDQWKTGGPLSIGNVFALDRFQNLCERYALPPTYLITYEVADDARAAQQFRAWRERGAEVGSHLHPWTTPPLKAGEEMTRRFPSELEDAELQAKFTALTQKIETAIGIKPTSYRAGRWGFDARQAELLQRFGYRIDLSVTPGLSWEKGKDAGPDFSSESALPHWLNGQVLEVPMTIVRTGLLRRLKWLRVFENTTPAQLRRTLRAAERAGLPAAVFMIHSSELVAGKSPYVKTPEALERVYQNIESLFAYCARRGILGVTASDFARSFPQQL